MQRPVIVSRKTGEELIPGQQINLTSHGRTISGRVVEIHYLVVLADYEETESDDLKEFRKAFSKTTP